MGKKSSVRKKILLALIGVAVVCAIFVGVGVVAKRANATTVKVIPVRDLNQADYMMDEGQSTLSGEITSSVTQKVELMQDAIISQVYVKVGDRVKPGDKLLTYDMTLKELELELAKLRRQSLENKLDRARARLESLENGGPIDDDEAEDYTPMDDGEDDKDQAFYAPYLHAFAQLPLRVVAALVSGSDNETVSASDGETVSGPDDDPIIDQPPEPVLYEMLDYDSVPYRGTGSKEDPLCFLCTGSEEGVLVKGSFFNKMAGYDAAGTQKEEGKEALWYRLEFHEEDRIADLDDPEKSLLGHYLRQGKEVMDPDEEKIFTLKGAGQTDDGESVLTSTPEPEPSGPNKEVDEEEEEDDWEEEEDDWEEEELEEPSMTREEAIKYQKNNIQGYELDIQKQSLAISKLEKELKEETATSTMEGVVTVVGDPQTGESDGEGFIEIESDDGYYVKGSLGELMLEQVHVGDRITGSSYESGMEFTAEIREIAAYPATGAQDFYGGMGNPNESYYPFVAHVTEDLELENGEGTELKITGGNQDSGAESIYLDSAMIRSEGGQYYVYRDNNGELQKKFVTAKRSSDGYSIVVTKGLSNEDKIAFPYGKGVEEGAKTEEGTMEQLYDF